MRKTRRIYRTWTNAQKDFGDMVGKARSFRLTKVNEARLEELQEFHKLDNPNMTLNHIIENYHDFVRSSRLIYLLHELKKEL